MDREEMKDALNAGTVSRFALISNVWMIHATRQDDMLERDLRWIWMQAHEG